MNNTEKKGFSNPNQDLTYSFNPEAPASVGARVEVGQSSKPEIITQPMREQDFLRGEIPSQANPRHIGFKDKLIETIWGSSQLRLSSDKTKVILKEYIIKVNHLLHRTASKPRQAKDQFSRLKNEFQQRITHSD